MSKANHYRATIKTTGEEIEVYRLQNGNYYDSKGISEAAPPSAKIAGKKEFSKDELTNINQITHP